jgi:hypothetical protein
MSVSTAVGLAREVVFRALRRHALQGSTGLYVVVLLSPALPAFAIQATIGKRHAVGRLLETAHLVLLV